VIRRDIMSTKNQLYRILVIHMVVIIIALAFFAGCRSGSGPTATQSSATSAVPTSTSANSYELKWTSQWAPGSPDFIADDILSKLITQKTNGKVKITYYGAESLGKTIEWLNMLQTGATDMASLVTSPFPGQFELELGLSLPMLGIPNRAISNNVLWELNNKGILKFNNYKIFAFTSSPLFMYFKDKKVTTLEDFNGMKLRASTADTNKFFGKLGATPVGITGPEIYMAIDRKTIDGYSTSSSFVISAKLYEVSKYCLMNPPLAVGGFPIVMSTSTWNKFPVEIQYQLEQAINDYRYEIERYYQPIDTEVVNTLKNNKVEVYSLSASENARFQQAAAAVNADWIAEKQGKGLPAKEMMDLVQSIVARYSTAK
jgi:TRAP-type transport system periplasmic protein